MSIVVGRQKEVDSSFSLGGSTPGGGGRLRSSSADTSRPAWKAGEVAQ